MGREANSPLSLCARVATERRRVPFRRRLERRCLQLEVYAAGSLCVALGPARARQGCEAGIARERPTR